MKKIALLLSFLCLTTVVNAATTWKASDRVAPVGKVIVTKNDLPSTITFKVTTNAIDNSDVATTKVIYIPKTSLSYAGNDNEVAAVITHEIGDIINGKSAKDKLKNFVMPQDNSTQQSITTTILNNRTTLSDNKEADLTGADLMVKAGYNPLAMVVVLTKMPASTFELLNGAPANAQRAMNVYNYLTYNYPQKVKAGYNCREYRAFLTYADPIVKERNSNKKKLAKFNKEQEKIKKQRAKNIAKYKATGGISGWDATYMILRDITQN